MLIADIALRAKVSPATVSRVINQPHLVAPDRLARVQAVMTAVNYVPTPCTGGADPSPGSPPQRRSPSGSSARENLPASTGFRISCFKSRHLTSVSALI